MGPLEVFLIRRGEPRGNLQLNVDRESWYPSDVLVAIHRIARDNVCGCVQPMVDTPDALISRDWVYGRILRGDAVALAGESGGVDWTGSTLGGVGWDGGRGLGWAKVRLQ